MAFFAFAIPVATFVMSRFTGGDDSDDDSGGRLQKKLDKEKKHADAADAARCDAEE